MTTIECYKSTDGWRWRAKRKGRIVADSGEAYKRLSTMQKSIDRLFTSDFKVVIAERHL